MCLSIAGKLVLYEYIESMKVLMFQWIAENVCNENEVDLILYVKSHLMANNSV